MKLSPSSLSLLEGSLQKAVSRYRKESDQTIVTDIHLQPGQGTGEFTAYNDDDEELASTTIEEWMTYEGDDFYPNVQRILTSILQKMQAEGSLDNLHILKPYSFVMVDEEKETIGELLLVDDDTLLLNDELLKGLDKELDDFLKNLLEQ